MLAVRFGLKNWAKKLYGGLEVRVENCTKCGECEPKCLYKLPIISVLQENQMNLKFYGVP